MPSQSSWENLLSSWHHRRFHDEDFTVDQPMREYSKDYDRLLYSTAFRRLGGVTQVAASSEIALFHNRLTHALKTAQVGTRIANHLLVGQTGSEYKRMIKEFGGLDPRVVRVACMAYNVGRPPFGFTAADELKRITTDPNKISPKRRSNVDRPSYSPSVVEGYLLRDNFSDSAQSFRIVSKLAFREAPHAHNEWPALNFTRGALAAMLKYPWGYGERLEGVHTSRKWGYYKSEEEVVRWVFGDDMHPPGRKADLPDREVEYRTIEAQVMDWADDISYAVHDVEDFFRVGLIPLNYLAASHSEWEQFLEYAWSRKLSRLFPNDYKYVEQQGEVVREKLFPKTAYRGSQTDRIALHSFASSLIKEATDHTSSSGEGLVQVKNEQLARIELLKQLTWYYVIDRPSLESLQRGQRKLIRSLYNHLVEWVEEVWDGEPSARRTSGNSSISTPLVAAGGRSGNELPARLIEYLDIVRLFDPAENTGDPDRQRISRAVVDYIASLTELQAVELNSRLTGHSQESTIGSWFLP